MPDRTAVSWDALSEDDAIRFATEAIASGDADEILSISWDFGTPMHEGIETIWEQRREVKPMLPTHRELCRRSRSARKLRSNLPLNRMLNQRCWLAGFALISANVSTG